MAEVTSEPASRLISATALMAAGTMTSRILGLARNLLLAALLGNATAQVDTFNLANGIPNMIYILLAGGVLNTVFVPQIVRAMKNDADGGEAYTNRLVTVGLVGLAVITMAATVAAPGLMWLYTDGRWKLPANAGHYDNIVLLAYLCLPQIFFYGVNVLLGQVLNSRGKFGPMAWSPIANNVIAVLVLAGYLIVWGTDQNTGEPFTRNQLLLLGLGSTLGIVVQAAVLIPFMRSAGFRYRPRFDLKGAGLGRTAQLAKWTLFYVIATQVAVWVVTRLASGATLAAAGGSPGAGSPGTGAGGVPHGAGLTVYNNAYLLWILPHSLITVSLATAMLPSASRRAAAGDLDGAGHEAMRAMRLATTAIVPAAVAFLALAFPIAQLLFGNGRGADDWRLIAWTLMAFAVGLIPFTCQYLCLRGFYALEDTRTPFLIQLVIAAVNIVLALLFVLPVGRPAWIAVGLALAYALSYVVGLGLSFRMLRARLPMLDGPTLVRHCIRLAVAVLPAGALAALICWLAEFVSDSFVIRALALVMGGALAAAVFIALARVLQIDEIGQIVATVLRRGRGGNGRGGSGNSSDGNGIGSAGGGTGGSAGNVADSSRSGDSDGQAGLSHDSITSGVAAVTGHRGDLGAPPVGEPGVRMGVSGTVPETAIDGLATAESSIVTHIGHSAAGHGMATGQATASTRAMDDAPTQVRATPGDPSDPDQNPGQNSDQDRDQTADQSGRPEPHLPAGTILAKRYRLEELLVSAQPAVTWRAFDQVLSRSVLVHLLPAGDERAPGLLAAARRAAVATDSRFLRVLDAVEHTSAQPGPDGLGSYIVCEYAVGQSLQTIVSSAPLTGLEAGWVVREVADAIAGVHTAGLYHQRINPDTVIITPAGNVKIVGLLIESVLRPDGPEVAGRDHTGAGETGETDDVYDLGRLLYAALVSRWPGGSAFGLPAAPHGRDGNHNSQPGGAGEGDDVRPQVGPDHQRWLTPRQVRHGVSPALDRICDQLLSAHPRHRVEPITSAAQLVGELSRVLGPADATADLERRLRHPVTAAPGVMTASEGPRSAFLDSPTGATSARSPHSPGHRARAAGSSGPGGPGAVGTSVRDRPGVAGVSSAAAGRPAQAGAGGANPLVGDLRGTRHPRRWIAVLLALALVAVLAIAVITVERAKPDGGTAAGTPSTSTRPSAAASTGAGSGTAITIAGARDFDPRAQGGNSSENPGQVRLAYDKNDQTRWTTLVYYGSPQLGRLKQGVGLVLDLGQPTSVGGVQLDLSGSGTSLQLRVPTGSGAVPNMNTDKAWRTVASASKAGKSATLTLSAPVKTQYVLVYLTSLPKEGNGYRGGIFEVEVTP